MTRAQLRRLIERRILEAPRRRSGKVLATIEPGFDGLFVTVGNEERNIHELTRAALTAQGLSEEEVEELEFDDEEKWLDVFDRVMERTLHELGATHVHDTETGELLTVDEYLSSSPVGHMDTGADADDDDDWQPPPDNVSEDRASADEWYKGIMVDVNKEQGANRKRAASLAATLRDEIASGTWHTPKADALKDELFSIIDPDYE